MNLDYIEMKDKSTDLNELKQVKKFFKEHPEKTKYGRKESGLDQSYIKSPSGKFIKIENKSSERHVLGAGAFARVKKSTSDTAIKIQKFSQNAFENMYEQIVREAEINLDMKIATTGIIIRAEPESPQIIFIQEMIMLDRSLAESVASLSLSEKMIMSIKLIHLVNDMNSGSLSQSGQAYVHNDIHLGNVMFDQHQNLRLIDFGYTQPLFKPDQLQNDIRQTLTTLYSSLGDSIFCSEELEKLNPVIRNVMMNTDSLLSHLKPEDRLPFVSAVLIAYQSNPLLTEDDIHQLMLDLPRIQRLNSDFKIDQKIMKMSEIEVIKILTKMREILTNDQQVINKQIKKCQNSIQIKDLPLLLQKSEIINTALSLTRMDTLHSPQHILFHLRKHLQASSIILNQVPTTLREGKGLIASIKRKFHPRVSSPTQIDAKIEASIRSDYQKYRRSLKEIKDESDEQLERHKPKP